MPKRTAGLLVALALAAAMVFATSSAPQQHVSEVKTVLGHVQAERFLPIRFEYKPGSALEKGLAAHIEKTNAELGVFLVVIRSAKDSDDNLAKMARDKFSKTYLWNPDLRTVEGKVLKGWEAIVPELRRILCNMIYVGVHSVDASLEYLPAKPESKSNIDFRAFIRTRLACAPTECTWLEGEACHRNLCTWEPCPGGI